MPNAKSTKRRTRRKSASRRRPSRKTIRSSARKKGTRDARKSAKDVGALFKDLVALQARLRAPNGCPWDRQQTHESLRTYLIEEAYEVLDALDSGEMEDFAGELGDLLLQVIFHAELAAEKGRFDIADVIERVHNKMVRRHPHVFGQVRADTAAQVLKNWEQLKAEERRAAWRKPRKGEPAPVPSSIPDGVPHALPGILEAHQLTRRASNVGFDWQDSDGLFQKLAEESRELRDAVLAGDRARQEEEVGDLLFVCVNLARFLGLDAEIALKKANRKFSRRFREMERVAAQRKQNLAALSPEKLEELWAEVKNGETTARTR